MDLSKADWWCKVLIVVFWHSTGVEAGEVLQSHGTTLLDFKELLIHLDMLQLRKCLHWGALPRGTRADPWPLRIVSSVPHIAGCEDLKRLPASTLSVRGVPWHAHAHPSGSRFAEAGRAGRTLGCESERANRTPSTPLLRGSGMLITIRCWWSLYGGLRLHDVIVIWWPRAYLLVF